MDITIWMAIIVITACFISVIWTALHWRRAIRVDKRGFDYCIKELQTMETYNHYLMVAIMVFLGLVIEKDFGLVPKPSLFLLLSAFLSASVSLFFIPVAMPECGAGNAKRLWLWKLICTQITVILTAAGVLSTVTVRFMLP